MRVNLFLSCFFKDLFLFLRKAVFYVKKSTLDMRKYLSLSEKNIIIDCVKNSSFR